ncbi:hypothetical protein E4U53_002578 [Claviceps sorghi]|nr:hypothetical protein E4U53_002578 [Claviceps sorghi]
MQKHNNPLQVPPPHPTPPLPSHWPTKAAPEQSIHATLRPHKEKKRNPRRHTQEPVFSTSSQPSKLPPQRHPHAPNHHAPQPIRRPCPRRVNGREGVAFVLKSLPENAKKLFQLLVGEVLIAGMEDEETSSRDDDAAGVEYRMVYNKAVEEFICSSEMAFRTLLKEGIQ